MARPHCPLADRLCPDPRERRYYDGGHTGYPFATTARAIGGDIREQVH